MSLANNIKQFREAQGISQEYVAQQLFMHQSTYSRIERRIKTNSHWFLKIAKVLETTPEVLEHYHLIEADSTVELSDLLESQRQEIHFLRNYTAYLKKMWDQCCKPQSR